MTNKKSAWERDSEAFRIKLDEIELHKPSVLKKIRVRLIYVSSHAFGVLVYYGDFLRIVQCRQELITVMKLDYAGVYIYMHTQTLTPTRARRNPTKLSSSIYIFSLDV